MHQVNLIGDDEGITYFTVDKIDKDYDFRCFDDDNTITSIDINERIISINIFNDLIKN